MSSEIDYRRIGRHFRAARQQLNLKQKDVAELLGVSVKTYSNMERGAQELSLYRIIQLCQLLKLKPGCVLDDCNDDLLTLETLPETVCEAKAQLMLLSSKCSDETAKQHWPIDLYGSGIQMSKIESRLFIFGSEHIDAPKRT